MFRPLSALYLRAPNLWLGRLARLWLHKAHTFATSAFPCSTGKERGVSPRLGCARTHITHGRCVTTRHAHTHIQRVNARRTHMHTKCQHPACSHTYMVSTPCMPLTYVMQDTGDVSAPGVLPLPAVLDELYPRIQHCCCEDTWQARLAGAAAIRVLSVKLPHAYLRRHRCGVWGVARLRRGVALGGAGANGCAYLQKHRCRV